jgi:DNA-binding FadR family transcriptional regulator
MARAESLARRRRKLDCVSDERSDHFVVRDTLPQMAAPQTTPLTQPRLAEIVARQLREEILSGRYGENDLLPRQHELVERFGVSAPSVREALRILETEGLITVQRGREGGAVVHQPRLEKVAYMLGMVLQSEQVPVEDAIAAYGRLEPAIAAQCAAQEDRATTIVPVLRDNLALARASLADGPKFRSVADQFHKELIAHSTNRTLARVLTAIETLVYPQIRRLNVESGFLRPFDEITIREASLLEHEQMFERIVEGDEAGAYNIAQQHLSEAHWPTPLPAEPPIVDAGLIA